MTGRYVKGENKEGAGKRIIKSKRIFNQKDTFKKDNKNKTKEKQIFKKENKK